MAGVGFADVVVVIFFGHAFFLVAEDGDGVVLLGFEGVHGDMLSEERGTRKSISGGTMYRQWGKREVGQATNVESTR